MDTFTTPSPQPAEIQAWLDSCERDAVHPEVVADRLRRTGWSPATIAGIVASYRARFNEHSLGYSTLMISTGLVALAAGSTGHLLVGGLIHPVNRRALARWLSLLVCALPIAAWSQAWAVRTDRDDPVAVWSQMRRSMTVTLLWACAVVGAGRLLLYVAQTLSVIVGATAAAAPGAAEVGGLQVGVVVAVTVPLALWAHTFLHRFDPEDPSVPVARRRPTVSTHPGQR